jgi:hypothetical protein
LPVKKQELFLKKHGHKIPGLSVGHFGKFWGIVGLEVERPCYVDGEKDGW